VFGLEWSEIAVIAVVALICIGPKDMPVAIRAITGVIKKMRRMAGEFQGHIDEMLREADLHEVSDTIRDIRGMNVRSAITRAIDPDGSVGRSLSDPFNERPVPQAMRPLPERAIADNEIPGSTTLDHPGTEQAGAGYTPVTGSAPPDFLPPGAHPPVATTDSAPEKPDFLPPKMHQPASSSANDI
jgi:sec-independent protein translocase protein TatB